MAIEITIEDPESFRTILYRLQYFAAGWGRERPEYRLSITDDDRVVLLVRMMSPSRQVIPIAVYDISQWASARGNESGETNWYDFRIFLEFLKLLSPKTPVVMTYDHHAQVTTSNATTRFLPVVSDHDAPFPKSMNRGITLPVDDLFTAATLAKAHKNDAAVAIVSNDRGSFLYVIENVAALRYAVTTRFPEFSVSFQNRFLSHIQPLLQLAHTVRLRQDEERRRLIVSDEQERFSLFVHLLYPPATTVAPKVDAIIADQVSSPTWVFTADELSKLRAIPKNIQWQLRLTAHELIAESQDEMQTPTGAPASTAWVKIAGREGARHDVAMAVHVNGDLFSRAVEMLSAVGDEIRLTCGGYILLLQNVTQTATYALPARPIARIP